MNFEKKIDELLASYRRRIEALLAAKRGEVSVRRVKVQSYSVGAYKVSTHWRVIAPRRGTVATRKRRTT